MGIIPDDGRERMHRVTVTHPCPVCGKPDWCLIVPDGSAAICQRVESGKRCGDAGWLHRLPDPVQAPPSASLRPRPPKDWPALAARFAANRGPDLRAKLAAQLGLPADALDALPLVGFYPDHPGAPCFTFPETDAAGTVVGILRRFEKGKGPNGKDKLQMAGGKRGLILPVGWSVRPGPVCVFEGPTCAASATAAGLAAIGRPSNDGGVALLAELFRDFPTCDIIIAGENDEKPNGDWPGRRGAESVARRLAAALGRPVRWALPPDGAKDCRDWLTADSRDATSWPDRGRELLAHLTAIAVTIDPPIPDPSASDSAAPGGEAKQPRTPPAGELLARIGLALDLWHDPTQTGFATICRLSHPVRSKTLRHYLVSEYRKQYGGKVPNAEALSAALNVIEATAVHDGPERPVFVRVAGHGGKVYLHLADPQSTVVEIDADGWRVCDSPPVRFRRPSGMLTLPMPASDGSLQDLRHFLNVPDDGAFALVLAWLGGCFRPEGPFPVMVLLGEQGSAKTTTARVLKRLLDPNAADARSEPKEVRDLMIQGRYNWVLAFDNLSGLPGWLSDAFCRLATGGGFSTRELYSNDEEVIFDAKRPLIVNGIEDFVTRPDLLERSLLIRHPPIPEEKRRPESEFWASFDAAHPGLLGAMLDRLSAGLRELPRVRLERLPRMADFALFAAACERGAGEGAFLSAYAENQAGAHEQALDASPLPAAVLAVMDGRDVWEGRPAELLAELTPHAPNPPPREWPKKPNVLTNRLRRLAPNLRRVHGLDVDCDGRESGGRSSGKRSRVVRITRAAEIGPGTPSPPSPGPAESSEVVADDRTAPGDGPGGRFQRPERITVPEDRPPARAADPRRPEEIREPGDGRDGGDDPSRPLREPAIDLFDGYHGRDQMLPD